MAVSAAIRETAAAREAPTAALAAAKKAAVVREAAAAREAAVVREAGAPTAALAAGGQLEGPPEEPDWQAFLTAASFLVTSFAAAAEASAGTTEAKPALVSLYTHSYFRAGHALIIFQMPQRLCRVHASYFFYMFQHRSNIQFDVNLCQICSRIQSSYYFRISCVNILPSRHYCIAAKMYAFAQLLLLQILKMCKIVEI